MFIFHELSGVRLQPSTGSYKIRLQTTALQSIRLRYADNNSKHLPEQYRFLLKNRTIIRVHRVQYLGGTITSCYLFVTVL